MRLDPSRHIWCRPVLTVTDLYCLRFSQTCAVGVGLDTYFHDLLSITSKEADMIVGMDGLYSKGSRLAASLGTLIMLFFFAL